nr:hypothetical protein [Prevotella fusca]
MFSVGLNCSFGVEQMRLILKSWRLKHLISSVFIQCRIA